MSITFHKLRNDLPLNKPICSTLSYINKPQTVILGPHKYLSYSNKNVYHQQKTNQLFRVSLNVSTKYIYIFQIKLGTLNSNLIPFVQHDPRVTLVVSFHKWSVLINSVRMCSISTLFALTRSLLRLSTYCRRVYFDFHFYILS